MNAAAPRQWFAFLDQLWPDDPDSINVLQQIFGYCLTSSTKLQKAFMVVGPTRSGKGTIGRVLTALIGSGNTASPTLSSLSETFGRESLIYKRLGLIGDAKIGRNSDPVLIAEHILGISGEDLVTISRKNKSAWTGHLTLKLVVLCTEVPKMIDDSAGIASRFIILRLTESFLGNEDLELTDKLRAELPGIAVWAVGGWTALFGKGGRGKIAQPQSAEWDVGDIKNLASDIKQYLDERCKFDPKYHVERGILYKDYCSWRESQGLPAVSKPMFGRKLKTAFPQLKDYRPESEEETSRQRHYSGLRLQPLQP